MAKVPINQPRRARKPVAKLVHEFVEGRRPGKMTVREAASALGLTTKQVRLVLYKGGSKDYPITGVRRGTKAGEWFVENPLDAIPVNTSSEPAPDEEKELARHQESSSGSGAFVYLTATNSEGVLLKNAKDGSIWQAYQLIE